MLSHGCYKIISRFPRPVVVFAVTLPTTLRGWFQASMDKKSSARWYFHH